MSKWLMVRLGEVMTLRRPDVEVSSDGQYHFAGIYCFGGGAFVGQKKSGLEFAYKRLTRLQTDNFTYPKLMAWEGAFAVVPPECNELVVSTEFPVFKIDQSRAAPQYIGYYFKRASTWPEVAGQSSGTNVRRRRLHPTDLLKHIIPLPPLIEQLQLVERLDALSVKINEAKQLRDKASLERRTLNDGWLRSLFTEPGIDKVGDFVRFQTGYAFKSDWFVDYGVRLARNVNVGHGTLNWADMACLPESKVEEFGRFALRAGDILISLDRPIISTGVKAARVTPSDLPSLLLQRVARAEFVSTLVDPEFFFLWLMSPRFKGAIDPGRSNGVPHISHKDIERIPFTPPSIDEQHRVLALANEMATLKKEADLLEATLRIELNAMFPSVLDQTFNLELER